MTPTIALGCALLVVAMSATLVVAWRRPEHFQVSRQTMVEASAERLYLLINDLHRFNTWNPYAQKDPHIEVSYTGPASGPGAAYLFAGNREVGAGSISIAEAIPNQRVAMLFKMTKPFAASNRIEFTLSSKGSQTIVTWTMAGHSPLLARLISLFVNMDHMIGRDFEVGLGNLKALAEPR